MCNRHFLGRIPLVACCCVAFTALGCSGMVGVEGWVVEAAPGEPSDVTMEPTKLGQPLEGAIENAWVELWTGDGKTLLDRQEPGVCRDGSFDVGEVSSNPYTAGMRYLIKAGAPGYQPLSKEVQLRRAQVDYALIQLAPVQQEDGQQE